MAGERGASAVLFDITEDRSAAEQVPRDRRVVQEGFGWREVWFLGEAEVTRILVEFCSLQLQQPLGLTWPVVLIWGKDAEKLMEFVYKNRKAHVRIELKEPPAWVSTPGLRLASVLHLRSFVPTPWKPSRPACL